MKDYYFVDKEGHRQGPLPLEDLKAFEITPKTLVWCKGMEKWAKAKDLEDFKLYFSEATTAPTEKTTESTPNDSLLSQLADDKEPDDKDALDEADSDEEIFDNDDEAHSDDKNFLETSTKTFLGIPKIGVIAAACVLILVCGFVIFNKIKNDDNISQNSNQPEEIVEQLFPTSASGKCDRDGNVYYEAKNLIDGDLKTCWALDVCDKSNYWPQGFGGVSVKVDCKRLNHIVVHNGYQKNNNTFSGNPRAKTIAIYKAPDFSNPILLSSLEDIRDGQTIYALEDNPDNTDISELLIFFPGDFYYSAKWNDLSVSEIEFYGVK